MTEYICNICGANLILKDERFVCPACGAILAKELTEDETILLANAAQKLRVAAFDDAEECYTDIINKYPKNCEGYWGLVLAKYGIKYEQDYDAKMLPTCYAISIESFLENNNYLKAIELADNITRKYYENQAKLIEKIRKEWVEKAQKEQPYDIFICYKDSDLANNIERTKDSYIAAELYNRLSKKYNVFFSRESLRDKIGELKYEPYIFNALNTAKVMIVYGSCPEYINSTWLKNEWLRYYKRIKMKQKQDNSLIVVCNGFNPIELSKPLNQMQCIDYKRITFLSDLEDKIKDIVDKVNIMAPKFIKRELPKLPQNKNNVDVETIKTIEVGTIANQNNEDLRPKTIERHALGTFNVTQLTQDNTTIYNLANSYMQNNLFEDAQASINLLYSSNKKNPQIIMTKMLADCYAANSNEFFKYKINNLLNTDLLSEYLSCCSKEDGEIMLSDICKYLDTSFTSALDNNAINIFKNICEYENESVNALLVNLPKYTLQYIKNARYDIAEVIADLSLKIIMIDKTIMYDAIMQLTTQFLLFKQYNLATKYNNLSLSIYSNDVVANLNILNIHFKTSTLNDVFLKCEDSLQYEIIDNFIKTKSSNCGKAVINGIVTRIKEIIDDNSVLAAKWIDIIGKYDFADRLKFIKQMLDICTESALDSSAAFDSLIKLYTYDKNKYVDYNLKMSFNLRKLGCNKNKTIYYSDVVVQMDNTRYFAYENKFLAELDCVDYADLDTKIVNLNNFNTLEFMLAVATPKKRIFLLQDFMDNCTKCVYLQNSKEQICKILDVFDRLLSYLQTDNINLEQYILNMANVCLEKKVFDNAEKYFAMALNTSPNNHMIYWGILKAKLNCSTNEDLIMQNTIISDLPEFNSAIVATNGDVVAINDYVRIKAQQKQRIATEQARKEQWIAAEQVRKKEEELNNKNLKIEKIKEAQLSKIKKKNMNIHIAVICLLIIITISYVLMWTIDFYASPFNIVKILMLFLMPIIFLCIAVLDKKFVKKNIIKSVVLDKKTTKKNIIKGDDKFAKRICITYRMTVVSMALLFLSFLTVFSVYTDRYDGYSNDCFCVNINGGVSIVELREKDGEVSIPSKIDGKNVLAIGERAFQNCSGLTSITIPNSVTSIGDYAFEGCSGLTSITIPNSVTSIGDGAFYDCSGLTRVTISDSVTSIVYRAFSGCSGLTSITIPDSVTSIGEGAFEDCSSLTRVTIPDSVTSIGDEAFRDCSGLTTITIPDSVTSIGDVAFAGCSSLTRITIPDSVTSIGQYTFSRCSGLTSITIPDSVTSIGEGAFYGCSGLTGVTIPDSVTSIGRNAFEGCSKLSTIYCEATRAPSGWSSNWKGYCGAKVVWGY